MPHCPKIFDTRISRTEAARRLGVTHRTIRARVAAGLFALDERGRIIRADFDKTFPPVAAFDESAPA